MSKKGAAEGNDVLWKYRLDSVSSTHQTASSSSLEGLILPPEISEKFSKLKKNSTLHILEFFFSFTFIISSRLHV